jgi:hypothetical protein
MLLSRKQTVVAIESLNNPKIAFTVNARDHGRIDQISVFETPDPVPKSVTMKEAKNMPTNDQYL